MKKHLHALPLALALSLTSGTAAASDLVPNKFLEDTGAACLASGVLLGVVTFFSGPALVVAGTGGAVLPMTGWAGAGMSALVGCGAGAAAALGFHGVQWGAKTYAGGTEYPLLYPEREVAAATKAD